MLQWVRLLQKEDQLCPLLLVHLQEVQLWHQELQFPLLAELLCLYLRHLLEVEVVHLLEVGEGEELLLVVWVVLQLH